MSTGIGSGIVVETEGVMMQQKEMIEQVLGMREQDNFIPNFVS